MLTQLLVATLATLLTSALGMAVYRNPTVKFCLHCKHYIDNGHSKPSHGRCELFPIRPHPVTYLVTGTNHPPEPNEYDYCTTARSIESMCGKEAKLFVEAPPRPPTQEEYSA